VSDGRGLEVLLVTSRRSSRWLIPKGWPMLGKTLAAAAAQEAYEEAGVRGRIDPQPLGSFRHRKQHEILGAMKVSILVHGLAVEQELPVWPEIGQRERQWVSLEAAAGKVGSVALAGFITEFGARVSSGQR
jgi:8-oxo-dGTP pyrophosphatase MutT (NUDIX family)